MDKIAIFAEALLKKSTEERRLFLESACAGDHSLRSELDALLAAHDDAGSFLNRTPEELAGGKPTIELSTDSWQAFLQASSMPHCIGTLGQYEVIELIGRGGMGVVLKARDTKLNRIVALKMLAPEFAKDPVAVQRFQREAQAAAAVSHDHVVTIHAVHEDLQPPIIAMEYITGKSLQQKIDQEGAFGIKSILRIGMQTAAGLAAAHRQGLVHRDIKPANILLENGIERVKLTDFGLARAIDDVGMTRTGTITGTPQYMSPEQAQGQPIDHRTDLFSLGCVMYAMCTGRVAFRADSAVAVMHCVVHATPRPIRESNEAIPTWLCDIVQKLLAKQPDARFDSATELEELLSRHLAHIHQPDNVPQPLNVAVPTQTTPQTSNATSNRADTELLKRLLFKIGHWTIFFAGYLVFLVLSQPTSELFAAQVGIIGLLSLSTLAFCLTLRKRQRVATKKNALYSGYDSMFTIACLLSLGIPPLLFASTSSILLGLLLAYGTSTMLRRVRMNSYTSVAPSAGRKTAGWTIIDQLHSLKVQPIPLVIAVGFVALALLTNPSRNNSVLVRLKGSNNPTPRGYDRPFISPESTSFATSKRPRDPVVDLDISPKGSYACVAIRGKVSSGFVRIMSHDRTSTLETPGIYAVAACQTSNGNFVWVGDDCRPHIVSAISAMSHSYRKEEKFVPADDGILRCVAWSSKPSRIFAAGDSGVHVWDSKGGAAIKKLGDGMPRTVSMACSFNTTFIAIGFEDGTLAVWNTETLGDEPTVLREPSEGSVTAVSWSADGTHLVYGTSTGSVTLMSKEGDSIQVSSSARSSPGQVCTDVCFSPDNIWIISSINEKHRHHLNFCVNPWLDQDFKPRDSSPKTFPAGSLSDSPIVGMKIYPNGSQIITGSKDGSYTTWKLKERMSYNTPNSRAPFVSKTAEVE